MAGEGVMFKKILIANRGEIAVRIIKTAKKMGVKTVAIYSDADEESLHVSNADEAIYIGASSASESYLNIDKIIKACKQTGAEAVHPGYGFLSENPFFCESLEKENIVFIGPNSEAIRAMGDKITSKEIAKGAGVSIIPGYMGLIENAEQAVKIANQITYPIMIKASAGGGGKGMRIAYNDAETIEGFARAKSEAGASFADDRIFIEKYIEKPRHIEIQVLGDKFGNIIYLGERECSIQRRNQKIIEEAPSPFLDEETRKKMGEQAIMLAKAVDYYSAGTVEFIVDKEKNFYFLEMNTRLQVEHPVTELVTNIDLVEQMLQIAAGKKLQIAQEDIKLVGSAIECRIYAEDPKRNFLPSTGRLKTYRPPKEIFSDRLIVRNDSGVYEGAVISPFYDPMIAKLCTFAPSRKEAINLMQNALSEFALEGVGNNIDFLQTVMGQKRFQKGDISTAYIAEEFANGFSGAKLNKEQLQNVLITIALMQYRLDERMGQIKNNYMEWVIFIKNKQYEISVKKNNSGWHVKIDNNEVHLSDFLWRFGAIIAKIIYDKENETILKVNRQNAIFNIRYLGADISAIILPKKIAHLMKYMPQKAPPDMSRFLLCPMPGQISRIDVKEGDIVEEGQSLAIIEAMKMENILYASKRGRVKKLNIELGSILAVDEIIIEFEEV